MKFVIISSSQRKDSNSLKVSNYLKEELKKQDSTAQIEVLDLAQIKLPFWDERMMETSSNSSKEAWTPLSKILNEAHSFIFTVPEWNGMVPPILFNFFLFCSQELSHKPALIASVSAGIGGVYPVSELRMAGYKNTRICYLPEHLIFRYVGEFLKPENKEQNGFQKLRERTSETLKLFRSYSKAFILIRESDTFDYKKFPSGM